MKGVTIEEAEYSAQQFIHLLDATFEEHKFKLVDADKIQWYLSPFEFKYISEITRRCEELTLDSLKHKTKKISFGFSQVNHESKRPDSRNAVVYIYPFLRSSSNFDHLFKLLLLNPNPVLISCMLQPTPLNSEVEDFLEKQILICERFAQGDMETQFPTLVEQARLFQRSFTKSLFGLRDNSALIQIRISSNKRIPHQIVDGFSSIITDPAGGRTGAYEERIDKYFAGGYNIVSLKNNELKIANEALKAIEITCKSSSLFPDKLISILYFFDSLESECIFKLPEPLENEIIGLETRNWRSKPIPKNIPETGALIGAGEFLDANKEVRIYPDDRRRHMYVVGQTGTGKTTILKSMVLSDIRNGEGVCVLDPHGDLFKEVLGKIPTNRINDVVVIDPTDIDFPVGLNLLELNSENERHFIVQEMSAIITKLIGDEYGLESVGDYAGPVFFQHMKMNLLLTMSNPQDPGTLLEFYNIFNEKDYWKRWLPLKIQDRYLQRWVDNVLKNIDYTHPGFNNISVGGWISSKFEPFLFDPMLRFIFAQKHSTINIRQLMDEGKIILVNLAKGELSESNSKFLGMVILAKIQAAAMARIKMPSKQRRDFYIYVDEFQNVATQNFITLLSEGRKFRVNSILANQFVTQVNEKIMSSILGNVGTIISFRLGQQDAELIEKELYPTFNKFDLLNLPNWYAYISTLIKGQATPAFTIHTLFDETPYDERVEERVRNQSRSKYGKSRADVEKMISESFNSNISNPQNSTLEDN